jgi:hypothetical protein
MYYVCRHPGCGRFFDTKHGRAAHERLVHGFSYRETEPSHVCPHCGDGFESEMRFKAHLRDHHGIPSKTLDWVEGRTFENLDLTSIHPILWTGLHQHGPGRPVEYRPECDLRALMLRQLEQIPYVKDLVKRLKRNPYLRQVCGYGDQTPSEAGSGR